jgi:predicted dinucleotide-binding enzyme
LELDRCRRSTDPSRLIADIPGMRWIDVGGLQMARIAETLTPLLISVNGRYKVHDAGFRLTGHDTWGSIR